MSKIKIDASQLNKAIDNAWASFVARVDTECIAVISDPTEFSDLGFNQQDIVLSGRLKDSQVVDIQGNKARFEWNPHDPETGYAYAMCLWMGFFAYGGHKFVPGRKWAFRALRRIDPVVLMAEELQKQGIGNLVVRNDVELLD